jgi:hypothetical protein
MVLDNKRRGFSLQAPSFVGGFFTFLLVFGKGYKMTF